EGIGKKPAEIAPEPEQKKAPEGAPRKGIPIKGLAVGEFAVTKGTLLWIDRTRGERKEIADLNLRLQDVSLDRPIRLVLTAMLDGRPIEVKANVGPVGKEPGKGTLPLEITLKALKELEIAFKGKLVDPATNQQYDLAVQVSPFSPRSLMSTLGLDFPVKTTDPKALGKVALKAHLKGDPKKVSISEGVLQLDESSLAFSMKARDFDSPNLAFDLNLDKIDLDRYLPPPSEEKPAGKKKGTKPEKKKTDYTPLRRLVLEGKIRVGELKVRGARLQDIYLKVVGKNGLFNLDPFSLKLYQGDLSSTAALDVRRDVPRSKMALQAEGIQVNPLLKDLLKKDIIEGTLKATMNIA
ncbi:MAG: AsmA family protein, partial [Deltaproteobacteria bacterium]|nr:AsmA family protein [Deltaproteobacteria bacterium]